MDFAALTAWHWFGFGGLLLIAELMTGTTYLLWPAVAAWVVSAILAFVPIGPPVQFAVFGALTIATTLSGRAYVKGGLLGAPADPAMNDRARRLVGARGQAATTFENGLGRVKLGDSEWRGASADAIGAGDAVIVQSVDGATVHVRRV